MKNVFDGLNTRLETTKERLSECEDVSTEREQTLVKQNRIPTDCDNYKKCKKQIMGIPEGKVRKEQSI